MMTDALREAIRTGRPFKITMADDRTLEVPHPEFAMISIFEAFDVVLITGVEKEGELPSRK